MGSSGHSLDEIRSYLTGHHNFYEVLGVIFLFDNGVFI